MIPAPPLIGNRRKGTKKKKKEKKKQGGEPWLAASKTLQDFNCHRRRPASSGSPRPWGVPKRLSGLAASWLGFQRRQ